MLAQVQRLLQSTSAPGLELACVLSCVKIFSAMPLLDKGTPWSLMVERGSVILCIGEAFSCYPRVDAKRLYRLGNISDAIAKSSMPEP